MMRYAKLARLDPAGASQTAPLGILVTMAILTFAASHGLVWALLAMVPAVYVGCCIALPYVCPVFVSSDSVRLFSSGRIHCIDKDSVVVFVWYPGSKSKRKYSVGIIDTGKQKYWKLKNVRFALDEAQEVVESFALAVTVRRKFVIRLPNLDSESFVAVRNVEAGDLIVKEYSTWFGKASVGNVSIKITEVSRSTTATRIGMAPGRPIKAGAYEVADRQT